MTIKPFLLIFFDNSEKACFAILFFSLPSLRQDFLLLYVQHNGDYVADKWGDKMNHDIPTVFISYSYDSSEHIRWVEKLALRMRMDGIKVLFDKWHLSTGDSLTYLIENWIKTSDFVIIVCTPNYKYKADNRLGGVGYEDSIITGEMINGNNNKAKFLPIIRKGNFLTSIPTFLIDKRYEDFTTLQDFEVDNNYNNLLSKIHDIKPDLPNIGKVPTQRIKNILNKNIYQDYRTKKELIQIFTYQIENLMKEKQGEL